MSGIDSTSLSNWELFSKILNYELIDLGDSPPVPPSLYRPPSEDRVFIGSLSRHCLVGRAPVMLSTDLFRLASAVLVYYLEWSRSSLLRFWIASGTDSLLPACYC